MDIHVSVVNQKLRLTTNLKTYVAGSQNFVKFIFNLPSEWIGLSTFAQFRQGKAAYNKYLDENNSVYLPREILAGTCTLILYGSGQTTVATTNYLTLFIDENILLANADSTEISSTLYEQLVAMVEEANDKMYEIEHNGTTTELVEGTVRSEFEKYIADGTLTNMAIPDGSITRTQLSGDVNTVLRKADKSISLMYVSTLPEIGVGDTIYFVPNEETNGYDKYVWITDTNSIPRWEIIGGAELKADSLTYNKETGLLQLTSEGKALPNASVIIELTDSYTKDEVDKLLQDCKDEASVGLVEWDESTRQLQLYNALGDPIGDPVTISGGGGGGGSSSITFAVTLQNTLDSRAITVAEGGEVQLGFTYSSVDEYGNDDGDGIATITVNNVRAAAVTVKQGSTMLDISKYLSTGDNTVKLRVENSEGSYKTIIYTVSVIAISVTTSFSSLGTYSGDVGFAYTVTGSGTKTVHFLIDNIEIGTEEVTSSSRSRSYIIPAQAHGGHILTVYATVVVDGVTVQSNTLTLGMLWIDSANMTPAITSHFAVAETTQGEALVIEYMVYDPTTESAAVTLAVINPDGSVYQSNDYPAIDRTAKKWTVYDYPLGNVVFRITCGETNLDLPVTVTESGFVIEPVTEDLTFEFEASGRSNNDDNPAQWSHGEDIVATFEGFGWTSADGWQSDAENGSCLRFLPGAKMEIPFAPFASDLRETGATIEVDLATHDVRDYDSMVLTCFSVDRGFQIASQYAQMKSASSLISMQFKEDSRVRISIVIEHKNLNRLLYLYVNGVMCRAIQYPAEDDFQQSPPVGLTIGAEACGIDLYRIRYYPKGLSRAEIIDNFNYDQPTLLARREAHERNDILDENDEVVISKLPPDLPYMVISSAALPQAKGDNKIASVSYTDPSDSSRSFTAEGVDVNVQGTSSEGYKKKNFKLKFKQGVTYTQNNEWSEMYQLRSTAIPAAEFTMKADVASSENANNVMLVDYYNELCPYKTPPQEANPNIRQGIWGRPCVIFWHNTVDNTTKFWGKYNFNDDKGSNQVFGLTDGCESWEFLNNTSFHTLFKTANFSDGEWLKNLEARFPEDYTDPTNLKRVFEWVVSTDMEEATDEAIAAVTYDSVEYTTDSAEYRLAKFKAEFEDYFIKSATLFYFLFTEIFLMVDSRAKNMFLSTFDGTHWLPLPYDMDTAIGINNAGSLAFDYDLEADDEDGSEPVFNGRDSVLWQNVNACFADELADMYITLRKEGNLNYDTIYQKFEDHQRIWPEALWNEDAYEKYLEPLVNDNDGMYLPMLQGDKASQRDWWLYNAFKYRDSKYHAGDALTHYIQLRCNQKDDITLTPYSHIWPCVEYDSHLVTERGKRNNSYVMKCPLAALNNAVVTIYSADRLAEIGDLSGLIIDRGDFTRATKLQKLIIGSNAEGYQNAKLNDLSVGTNKLLTELNIQNCAALEQTVDLSQCVSIETILAGGSSISGLSLPNGGRLTTLELPATIANFTILNQKMLTTATFEGYDKLTTLRIENTPNLPIEQLVNVNEGSILNRVRLVGVEWTATNEAALEKTINKLIACGGMTSTGSNSDKAVVIGKVYVDSVSDDLLATINDNFPELIVVINGVPNYLVRYLNYDGELLHREVVAAGANAVDVVANGTITAPTRPGDNDTGWVFKDWGTLPTNIQGNVSVVAQFTAAYAVRYKNWDGTELQLKWVEVGGNTSYTGSTPSRASTAQYTYKFTGWSTGGTTGAVSNVTSALTITAQYSSTVRTYTVWFYTDSTLLQTVSNVAYGSSASYTGSTPTKTGVDNPEDYEFIGWNPSGTSITGDTKCYAQYKYSGYLSVALVERTISGDYANTTVTAVEDYAFYTCEGLETVNFSKATSIGDYSFYGCNGLTSIVFPLVVSIGNNAFEGCSNISAFDLESVTTLGIGALKGCSAIPSVECKLVSTISDYAFQNCSALARADFAIANNIGTGALSGCTSLSMLILRNETMCTLSAATTLSGTPIASGSGYIYVPSALVDTYKADPIWSTYADQIRAIEDYPDAWAKESWETAVYHIENGDYATFYSIGDTIPLDLGSEGLVNMQIAAFDADDLADGSGKAHISFVSEQLLATSHRMNPSRASTTDDSGATVYTEGTGTIGGWEKSEMRTYLNDTILPLISSDVQAMIKPVTKYSDGYNTAGSAVDSMATTDSVWIPSYREIYGGTSYETVGATYTGLFASNSERIKKKYNASSANYWWLRSANSGANFRCVGSDGSGSYDGANDSYGVALGFCI